MKAPICSVCLKSNILCTACQKKLDEGLISEADIKISRKIHELSEKIKVLREAEIKKVIETQKTIIIIANKGTADKLVGKGGIAVRKIGEVLGKHVKVVEESENLKEFVQNLLFPVPVLTINTLYTAEREILRVLVPKRSRLSMSVEEFKRIMKIVFNKDAEIIFK